MAREPISAYQYYMSINDTAKAANYDSAAADGSEENPYAIRDWYDIYNVYNSLTLGNNKYNSFILVNDIDFNKVSTRRLNALQAIETIPNLNVSGFFDFNGHSFKNIIFRNMSGTCGNKVNVNNGSTNFLGCLIQISAASVTDDLGNLKPLIIKNVKIENFIINESYPSNYTSGYNGYSWAGQGCSIFYILQPNSGSGGTTIIENTDINVTFNMTNYAKTELITHQCDYADAIEHYKFYSCGVFRFGYPSFPILFKNVFIKCSGIVKHAFAVKNSDGTILNSYVTHGYPLNILSPNGGNVNRSSNSDYLHKFSINAQYVDCAFDFNDFIIQIPIDLAYGDILTGGNNYGFTDRCEVFNHTALFPYSKNSSDSIHITGHLKILLPTKEEIDANPLSFGVLYLFRSSTNTNVLWDARISIIDDIETPNLKIRSSSGTKLFMNKDKIDQIVLDNNLMVDDDPSGSGIFMCTTEQLKDEDFLNKNGFFYLRTT